MKINRRPCAALALSAVLLASVAGCGAGGNASSPPTPSPSSSATSSGSGAAATPSASVSPSASPSASPDNGASGSAPATPSPSPSPSPSASGAPASPSGNEDPIRLKVDRMTLEEKVGQLILAGIAGTTLDANAKRMIADDHVGGVILYSNNIKDVKGLVSLVNAIKTANVPNPAPIFVSADQEGGRVNRLPAEYAKFPANGVVGKTGDANAAGEMGSLIGRAMLSAGLNMDFAPVLDVNSNPDNPVIGDRSFGATAPLVKKLGIAELKGIRGEGVIPVVKHFPGHGDTSVDSHHDLPVINKTADQLEKLELVPFEAAIQQNAEAVMVAHILFPKIDPDMPGSLSGKIINGLLRDKLGYQGVVITDDLGMGAIVKHYTLPEAAVDAIQAGADILLVGHGYDNEHAAYEAVLKGVKNGRLTEDRIDESVYRILKLKAEYDLHDRAGKTPDLSDLNADIAAWKASLK